MRGHAVPDTSPSDSEIIYVHLPGQAAIIVNSVQVALDLMEKRSRIYSDKPIAIMDEL